MKREIVGIEKAHAFWAVAREDHSLVGDGRLPDLYRTRDLATRLSVPEFGERPVKVYLVVEDD